MPTFTNTDLSGKIVTIGQTVKDGRQILLVFATTCPFSLASLPAWQEIATFAATIQDYPVSVRAISLNPDAETRAYAAKNRLGLSVVGFPEPKLAQLFRASVTPQTLIVNDRGGVLYARPGTLQKGPALDSIIDFLATGKRDRAVTMRGSSSSTLTRGKP